MVITLPRTVENFLQRLFTPIPKVFDYEGFVVLPAVDLAWMLYRSLSEDVKQRFTEEQLTDFDKWDDRAWVDEHPFLKVQDGVPLWDIDGLKRFYMQSTEERFIGHSTGTTPIASDCIAACDGVDDKHLIEFVGIENYINGKGKTIIQESPGIEELLEYAMENGGAYLATNSHPIMSLATAHKYGIPSSHVVSHGHQLSTERLRYFDFKRSKGFDRSLFEEELRERSPFDVLIKNKDELAEVLDKLFPICSGIFKASQSGDKATVAELNKARIELFDKIISEDLRREFVYLLKEEKGITGGHNKVWTLWKISREGNLVFGDDSIVGADGLAFSKYGFAINNTDPHSLYSCKVNFLVPDFSLLIPVYEDIDNGKFDFDKVEERYSGLTAFTPRNIRERFDYVMDANREMKNHLKALYRS
ncbi:MAG: hypothetical protein QMD14_00350 [Candidatus Aenigmarchaeota archaeon]|nr:hypothetical protein [Candidatus Aenigmarchaeota archaeon]